MDEIIIVEHNPDWKLFFALEVERIYQVLNPDSIVSIEHFGSTAISGLAAKPIIDILIGVNSLVVAKQQAVIPLKSLGYRKLA